MVMFWAVFLKVALGFAFVYFIIKLIFTVFRIAKALEGIDETLYQIHNKLEDKSKSQNNNSNNP